MPTGSVITFKADKGYGFIRPQGAENNDDNVYVHITQLQEGGISSLTPGQRLSYDLETNENGKAFAANIKIIE